MSIKAFFLGVASVGLASLLLGSTSQRAGVSQALALVRGNSAYKAGAYGDAEVWFRKTLAAEAGQSAGQYNLGNALCQQGRYTEAAQCYQRALATCPRSLQAQAWANLGRTYYQLGRVPASYVAYRHALLLKPFDEATRQDFLFVQAQLAAQPKAVPHRPPAPPTSQENQKPASETGSKSDQKEGASQPTSASPQKLSEKEMQELFGAITQQETHLRNNLSGTRQQASKPTSDEKDY